MSVAYRYFSWIGVVVREADVADHFHIIPIGDLREHEPSPDCWCYPAEDEDDPGIWVHHSMDRREEYERGRMKH